MMLLNEKTLRFGSKEHAKLSGLTALEAAAFHGVEVRTERAGDAWLARYSWAGEGPPSWYGGDEVTRELPARYTAGTNEADVKEAAAAMALNELVPVRRLPKIGTVLTVRYDDKNRAWVPVIYGQFWVNKGPHSPEFCICADSFGPRTAMDTREVTTWAVQKLGFDEAPEGF